MLLRHVPRFPSAAFTPAITLFALFAFSSGCNDGGSSAGDGDTDPSEGMGGSGGSDMGAESGGTSRDLEPGVPGAEDLAPTADHPYVQLFGRWNHADPKAPVAGWGGVYLRTRFSGTSIKILLTDEQLTAENGVGTGNVYQYQIDDGEFVQLSSTSATEYELASGLPNGEHTLTFVRRTESKFGSTTFNGLLLDAGAALLPPPLRPTRKIEVFGDSISAGLANENRGDYRNINENGYEAFGPQLARMLDAEWRVEARGGGSLLQSSWLPMLPWFDKFDGPEDMEHLPPADALLWDFSVWQPDVFILALGTNDSSEMYPAENEAVYVAKYSGFLADLRAYYPNTEIFGVAPWKEGAPWDLVRSHIEIAIDGMNDPHMHAIVPLEGTAPNYSGHWLAYPDDYVNNDEYHPNIGGNTKIAEALAGHIAPIMGWDE